MKYGNLILIEYEELMLSWRSICSKSSSGDGGGGFYFCFGVTIDNCILSIFVWSGMMLEIGPGLNGG